jgi:hypothetical protein
MNNLELLKRVTFGSQIAEEETNALARYFVETDQWNRIEKGEIDIVRGEKGSGKSAIYSLLNARTDEFFDRGILLITAENPRGTTVFKDLSAHPPTSETEFVVLWKLYILTLIADRMRDFGIKDSNATQIYGLLEEAGFLEREMNLSGMLRLVHEYARRLLKAESMEGGVNFDMNTGMPTGITGKITLREPSSSLRSHGFQSIDGLLSKAQSSLATSEIKIWVLLDRLDVAFADNHELEANAMRALFKVYRDIQHLDNLSFKIFIREDIWLRISEPGMREGSHLTRYVHLTWTPMALLNLIIRRLLNNDALIEVLNIDAQAVLRSYEAQDQLFYRLFPLQVDQGRQKSRTFRWLVTRCADGTQKTAPRELIHLMNSIREKEIARLEHGGAFPDGGFLFDRSVFKEALPAVSDARLKMYLYAEYPEERPFVQKLRKEKTEQTPESLAKIWGVSVEEAGTHAQKLTDLGFFLLKDRRTGEATFWVPFLYRDALEMVQGREREDEEEEEDLLATEARSSQA